MTKLPISLVIIARDEAAAIGRCLDSVPFASEKLVIDSGSTDGTQQVSMEHGARVVQQDWLGFGPQRNFATTQAQFDWILVLDADEALSPELQKELAERLPSLFETSYAGAVLRRQTWYMGAPMRWYRPMTGEKLGRIYHRQRARWTDARVHESLRFAGPVQTFTHPFVHLHNPSLVHKHLKTMLYAELKARDWQDKGRKAHPWMTPLVFIAAFFKDYFLRLAFLDGWRGYAAAHVAASYAAYKRLRFYEMTRNPESRAIAAQAMLKHGLERPRAETPPDA